jgi:hypothetical protein
VWPRFLLARSFHHSYELRGLLFNGEASKRWVAYCPHLKAEVSIKVVDLEHEASELEALQVLENSPTALQHMTWTATKSMNAQGTFHFEGNH